MDKREFQKIATKISDGTATKEEVSLFNAYYNYFQAGAGGSEKPGNADLAEEEIRAGIDAGIRAEENIPVKYIWFPYRRVAAIILLLIISVVLYTVVQPGKEQAELAQDSGPVYKNDVDPGGSRATLTLADGSRLVLDQSANGTLAKQGSSSIEKTAEGSLVYAAEKQSAREAEDLYNTITIPRGGNYRLTLPDGTNVWLNASSSLRFPASFTGKERVVELKGEAYFEVARKLKANNAGRVPFIVKTAGQKVEVLGTHFNISAYEDEASVKTTLLEGSVRVTVVPGKGASLQTGGSRLLRPGQQSLVRSSLQSIVVSETDTEEAVAWKNGMFYFNNTDLETIMGQLARWYDIETDIKNVPDKRFNGILPRNVKLSQVLDMMEKTSGLKFKIEGRRISMLQ